ncbi:hypothetical protein DFS34DRAFT_682803 [Phlyctochytrium arcticum]|nr:hypothetical protein DFS34DRAFT_682803 [Phlyctochytrium arcticum]
MPAALQLPPEIIAQIVEEYGRRRFLPEYGRRLCRQTLLTLCLVSRTWKDHAQAQLWTDIEISFNTSAKSSKALFAVFAANPQLRRFVETFSKPLSKPVSYIRHSECKVLAIVPTPFTLVTHYRNELGISGLKNQIFHQLVQKCPKLARLHLGVCHHIKEADWIRAAPLLKNLRHLYLSTTSDVGDKAVRAIIDSCVLLEGFYLYRTSITCDGISYVLLNARKLVYSIVGFEKRNGAELRAIWRQHPARLDFDASLVDEDYNGNGEDYISFKRKKDARLKQITS